MGCEHSQTGPPTLSHHQTELIKTTWQSIGDRKLHLGVQIYHSLIRHGGTLRKLFPRLVRTEEKDGGSCQERVVVDEDALTRHALLVMDGLDMAVSLIGQPPKLQQFLAMVGRRHSQAGVPDQVITQLWPYLHEGFQTVLGEGYTREVQRAWKTFFYIVCNTMRLAMQTHSASLDSVNKVPDTELL